MQNNPLYADVVTDILALLRERRDALLAAGIAPDRIALDPGIGFGKTHEHNLTLMRHAWCFHELGCPVLIGHSRKGFIAKTIGRPDIDADAGTVGGAIALALQGVQIIRVHNVAAVRQALQLFEACGGLG
jgi:dihydropteroate synthase